MHKPKFRLVAVTLMLPLALIAFTVSASAVSLTDSSPQDSAVAAIEGAADGDLDECVYTQTAVVELDDGSTLALDDSGSLSTLLVPSLTHSSIASKRRQRSRAKTLL